MCAHIGTPRCWLLLDDLKWETWKKWILLTQVCQECVGKNRVLQVKGKTSCDLSGKSGKQEVMERYVICFPKTLL